MKTTLRSWLAALLIIATAPALAQQDIAGTWTGQLPVAPGTTVEIHFVLTKAADGSYSAVLNSPDPDGIKNIVATSTSFEQNRLVMAVDSLSGRYEGVFENGTIRGNWHQQDTALPLDLLPFVARTLSAEAKARLRGSWVGPLVLPQGELTFIFRFEDNAEGAFVGFLDSPDEGATGVVLGDISLEGDAVRFTVPQARAELRGTLTADSMALTFSQAGASLPITVARGEYTPSGLELSAEAVAALDGSWIGRMTVGPGSEIAIVFRFEQVDGRLAAFLDSPDQARNGLPITEVTLENGNLTLEIPALQATYRATLTDAGMTGTWAQGQASLPLAMARGEYTPTVVTLDLTPEAMQRLAGGWRGPMGPIEIRVRFETNADGAAVAFLDAPAEGGASLAITEASLTGDALELAIPAVGVSIAATLSADAITGQWRQGAANTPLTLTKQR